MLRQQAHFSFDRIWQRKVMTRGEAYQWLAYVMGVEEHQAHMGQMEHRCRLKQVTGICDGIMGTVVDEDFASEPPPIPT